MFNDVNGDNFLVVSDDDNDSDADDTEDNDSIRVFILSLFPFTPKRDPPARGADIQ